MDDNENYDVVYLSALPLDVIYEICWKGLTAKEVIYLKSSCKRFYKDIDFDTVFEALKKTHQLGLIQDKDRIEQIFAERRRTEFVHCYDPERQCPQIDRFLLFFGVCFAIISVGLGLLTLLDDCKPDKSCQLWMKALSISAAASGFLCLFFSSMGLQKIIRCCRGLDEKIDVKIFKDSKIDEYKKFLIYEKNQVQSHEKTSLLNASDRKACGPRNYSTS